MSVTFEIKALAKHLSSVHKTNGGKRPTTYQDFLQAISSAAGYSSYEAYMAIRTPSTAASPAGRPVKGVFTSVWESGHTVVTSCVVDLATMRVLSVEAADANDSVQGLYEQWIELNGVRHQVIEGSSCYPEMDPDVRYAISSRDDLNVALQAVIGAVESAQKFEIGDCVGSYGLRGDYWGEVDRLFDQDDEVDFGEELDQITMWFFEARGEDGDVFEESYSVYQMLFASVCKLTRGTFLVVPTVEGTDTIRLLS